MSCIRTSVLAIFALCIFTCRSGLGEETSNQRSSSQNTGDELLKKYLAALDRLDMAEATRTLEQANKEAQGQPATELMQRHVRLLAEEKIETRKYPVADLVRQLPIVTVTSDKVQPLTGKSASQTEDLDYESLIDLITATVAAVTWNQNGGPASIAPDESDRNLVIRQFPEVHEKIANLLQQARQEQKLRIRLETRFITLAADTVKRCGVSGYSMIDKSQASQLIKSATDQRENKIFQAPTVTVINGQIADYREPLKGLSSCKYQVQAVVSKDHQQIGMTVETVISRSIISYGDQRVVNVNEGISLLRDLSASPDLDASTKALVTRGGKLLLLITPRIIVQVDEKLPKPVE